MGGYETVIPNAKRLSQLCHGIDKHFLVLSGKTNRQLKFKYVSLSNQVITGFC
jgi:hypothetical protein